MERSAGRRFLGTERANVAFHKPTPAKWYAPRIPQGLIWVAADRNKPIGFASIEPFEDALHLWELAVRLAAQGRGAGTALIEAVADDARARGLPAVTLTTFRDLSWNAPFYARRGFVEVSQDETRPRLADLREHERSLGLDVSARCAMSLAL
ncbi:GNAT family N-acetyltransferase [Phenylobacterium sp.]|uniref:GNAT family N-acetyltransferase n=1 Tax=Phenylobacterium sp. TaxID=1871053 RepID=UPI002F3EBFD9